MTIKPKHLNSSCDYIVITRSLEHGEVLRTIAANTSHPFALHVLLVFMKKMTEEEAVEGHIYKLIVGDSLFLKDRRAPHRSIIYAGMPTKETFSLAVLPHTTSGLNLFYRVNESAEGEETEAEPKRINLIDISLIVHDVNPDRIVLEYVGLRKD